MIRFKINSESTDILNRIKVIYGFGDTVSCRIAVAISVNKGRKFKNNNNERSINNGREFTPTSNIFGRVVNDVDNYVVYKSVFNQHYNKDLTDKEFTKYYRLHIHHGLSIWNKILNNADTNQGEHIGFLLNIISTGLNQKSTLIKKGNSSATKQSISEFKELLSFEIGQTEDGETVNIRLNDLKEFDNRNIAIAGMAGSGKTQLIKDVLYQIAKTTNQQLKFIFFDYKGEGNPKQLASFLEKTGCKFVDIVENEGLNFNPFKSISLDKRHQPFSIKAFVDTIATFVPSVGIAQKNILTNIITELFNKLKSNKKYPTITELFEALQGYYEENNKKQDTLYAGIQDLTFNIFNCNDESVNIFKDSLYLNLPPALSDTLRQLIVFLLLRYFNAYFSSTNDCEPIDNIFPVRYVIVIDEAHIYLKNKNARKALEELLRLLRSKGVIIIMLSQGVEDFKTKDFDFASQVKLPICLNIQNKDYKSISHFVGTPTSKWKLESEIKKLESGKGLINIKEPQIIQLRQFWKTSKLENL